jgi:hypothetical protein
MDVQANMQNIGIVLERYEMLYFGIGLILSSPVVVALAQAGLALREITLNSRKEDHPASDTQYKFLEWICHFFFIAGFCQFILGVIMLIKAY